MNRTNRHIKSSSSKSDQIFNQFLNHCATIIQRNFKGYRQRKQYRQFLPIYRRVRELLFAGLQGWKTRRILKLQHVKCQIQSIKNLQKNQQISRARIAKRQFIDDFQRNKRRGRWIELLLKERNLMRNMKKEKNKQNTSLYGNIKPKSIKNIFNKYQLKSNQRNKKNRSNSKLQGRFAKETEQIQNSSFHANSNNIQQTTGKKEKALNYDEIQLKSPKDFYQLLEEKFQQNTISSQKVSTKKVVKTKTVARKEKGDVKNLSIKTTQTENSQKSKQSNQKQLFPTTPHSNVIISELDLEKSSKPLKNKKLKITLTKRKEESSQFLSKSQISCSKTSIKEKLQEVEEEPLGIESKGCSPAICQLLKTYHSSYNDKKLSLKEKLKSSFPNSHLIPQLNNYINSN